MIVEMGRMWYVILVVKQVANHEQSSHPFDFG